MSHDQQVINVLQQMLLAGDSNDTALLLSVLDPNFEYNASAMNDVIDTRLRPITGAQAAVDAWAANVMQYDTTHHTTDHHVREIEADKRWELKCHQISYHNRPGEALKAEEEGFMAGNEMTVEVVFDDNKQGKLKSLSVKPLWAKGDASIFKGKY